MHLSLVGISCAAELHLPVHVVFVRLEQTAGNKRWSYRMNALSRLNQMWWNETGGQPGGSGQLFHPTFSKLCVVVRYSKTISWLRPWNEVTELPWTTEATTREKRRRGAKFTRKVANSNRDPTPCSLLPWVYTLVVYCRAVDQLVPGREITTCMLVVTPLLSGRVIGRFFPWKHCCVHKMRALEHGASLGDGEEL